MSSAQFSWIFDGTSFKRDVELSWSAGKITSIQSVAPVDNALLVMPGLINLHAHLELTKLRGLLPQNVSFPAWVSVLKSLTQAWQQEDYEESVRLGLAEMLATGTTTVLDVGNRKANWHQVETSPLRLYAMLELIALDPAIGLERFNNACQELPLPASFGCRGLSAHAPFSCAPELMNAIAKFCKQHEQPFTMHLSESQGEQDLYAFAGGEYRPWIDAVYAAHSFKEPIGGGSQVLRWLDLPAANVIVHGNALHTGELAWLAEQGLGLVHCPQSARWFGHPDLNVQACVEHGVKLCIGTDSLASADSLSLWDQLREFRGKHPFAVESLLAMVTRVPGEVLDPLGFLGVLRKKARADFIVLQAPADFDGSNVEDSNWSWILAPETRVQDVFVNGTRRK